MLNGNTNNAGFDLSITESTINATGPKASLRAKEVIANLTRHLHDFCRESKVTRQEFETALDMVTKSFHLVAEHRLIDRGLQMSRAGQMTNDKRNEMLLLTDILGSEALIDDITSVVANDGSTVPTALGPFWRLNAPRRKMGETIVFGIDSDQNALMHGTVQDSKTGEPIANAEIDVWETAPNGMYEQQDPDQVDMNLRGIFTTDSDGQYSFYCLRPTTYAIPQDGPAGDLLKLLDRHPMRPAHIHFIVAAPGYNRLVTELFDRHDKHVNDDAVFAVKESLIVDFLPLEGNQKAQYEVMYNFKLGPT